MTDPVADLLAFIDAAKTPWHAVAEAASRLERAGYRRLDEREEWQVSKGDRVYVIRGGGSLAAFELGTASIARAGFRIVGAHTDSPNLRVKPVPVTTSSGAHMLAVEPYGGVLWHTWLDRDLTLAGRVHVRGEGGVREVLVEIEGAFARVPSLAIHLNREVSVEGLKLNPQAHLPPLAALASGGELDLARMIAERARVPAPDVLGMDLCLADAQPSARGGARGELVFAPRLDNLGSCHAALSALLAAQGPVAPTRGIVLYDHEEVGSMSAQGADSPFLSDVLERLSAIVDGGREAYARALARSFVISSDMAHAVHPSWADKHEPGHRPELGKGPVIKTNANQRYATDSESRARFVSWARASDIATQDFVTRSDLPCGTTVGPLTAGRLGVRTIDIGNPMLSMHSCREMAGAGDVEPMIRVLETFLERDD